MTDSMDGMTLCALWDHMAQSHANDEFLIFHGADERELSFTYGQFDARINQAANLFLEAGIRKGDTVAVHLCTSVEFMVCLFGLAKIGGIMVPVNEQNLQDESLYVLQKCSARMVVTEAKFLDMYRTILSADSRTVGTMFVARTDEHFEDACNFQQALDRQPATLAQHIDVASSDTVEVMFTSGTTSAPKGVEFTHANLIYAGLYGQWQVSMRADDRMMTTMPACHSNFQLAAMMPIIVAGGVLVMVEKYSAHRFWNQARAYRATLTQCVSMMVRTLLLQPPCEDDACNDIREVLYFLPIDTAEKEEFERRFDTRILNSYGSTESLTWVITDFSTGKRKWPSVGRVGLGYEAKIVDDNGAEVPVGTIGEIAIKGVPGRTIMKGYFRDPEHTAQTILADGWMLTGDKGYVDEEGFYYFADRKANMIKRAGENISTTEVEEVLLGHEGIKEAAVIGVPDSIRDQAVKAFVVPEEGAALDAAEIKSYCAGALAAFKVPSIVEVRASLPHTCSMKIEKKLLR